MFTGSQPFSSLPNHVLTPHLFTPLFFPLVVVPELTLLLKPWVHFITPVSLAPPGCAGELDPPLKLTPSHAGEHDPGQRHGGGEGMIVTANQHHIYVVCKLYIVFITR